MSERGLGTPATRAAIIEGLIAQKYIVRDGRELMVTPNGMRLIHILNEMKIAGLTSPTMTGEWEYKLRQMEQGQLQRAAFMQEIEAYTKDIVSRAKSLAAEIKNRAFPDLQATCPKCGAQGLKQTDESYECREPECGFKAKKYIAGRLLAENEAKELFSKRLVGPLEGFKSKFNKPFDAALELDAKFKVNFVFGEKEDAVIELTDEMIVGTVPLADGRQVKVYGTEKAYLIPDLKTKKDPEGVRIGRTILQKEVPQEQVFKMLAEGKTELIKGFISNKTKRGFDAFLTFSPADGKVGFEFPPRAPKAKK
jgi:DNA topoisomerase-3